MIIPRFIDHLVFRVAELARTERFYNILLGETAYRTDESIMFQAGETRLFFTMSVAPQTEPYDKEHIGVNHLAFGVRSLRELQTIEMQLTQAGLAHSGIQMDHYGLKEFIWLDDPDGMRVEFYLRTE